MAFPHRAMAPFFLVFLCSLTRIDSEDVQQILIGTHTSGAGQDHLMIGEIAAALLKGGVKPSPEMEAVKFRTSISHKGDINKARAMPQNPQMIATQADGGEIRVFNAAPGKSHLRLKGHTKEGYGLSWNPKQQGKLLTGSNDCTVSLWDVSEQSGAPAGTFEFHKSGVQDVAWEKTRGDVFCSAGEDKTVAIWDLRKDPKKPINVLRGHEECVNCVDFSPLSENMLAVGSADHSISIWDMRSLSYKQCSLEQHNDEVVCAVWSPLNPGLLASCSKDGRAMVWDLGKLGEEISKEDAKDGPPELIFTHGGHTSAVSDIAWNGKVELMLATVAEDNTLQIWQMVRGMRLSWGRTRRFTQRRRWTLTR